MKEKINTVKEITSFHLGIRKEDLHLSTIIDNSKLQGSIKIHLMYGELADKGFKVIEYSKIRTFGELLNILEITNEKSNTIIHSNNLVSGKESKQEKDKKYLEYKSDNENNIEVGLDILQISKMPLASDYRESGFYTDNFSKKELAYCLLKESPLKCFAGKFAAKEAIVKSNNIYKDMPFNKIEILNNRAGKPFFKNISISISYEDDYAIAFACFFNGNQNDNTFFAKQDKNVDNQELTEKTLKELKLSFLMKSHIWKILLSSVILNLICIIIFTLLTD